MNMTSDSHSNYQQQEPENTIPPEYQSLQNPNQEEPGQRYTEKCTATHKYCPDCGEMRPHSEFSKNSTQSGGLQGYCTYHQNKRTFDYKIKYPGKKTFDQAKHRAKENGLEFTITYEQMMEKDADICPFLGVPIFWTEPTHNEGRTPADPFCKSIDRLDSTKGYTYDNILIVSWRANKLKNDATWEEFKTICDSWQSILAKYEITN